MKEDLKELRKYLVIFVICLCVSLFCAKVVFSAPLNEVDNGIQTELTENTFSGRKAVGMFINSYTGAKVAVCLEDINNCVIKWITGNSYSENVHLSLREFKNPIYEIVNNAVNASFHKLFEPTTLLR